MWQHDDVLREIGVATLSDAQPLLSVKCLGARGVTLGRHAVLRRTAGNARDWDPCKARAEDILAYLWKVFRRKGAHGPSGSSAAMWVLGGLASFHVVLWTILIMVQRCGRIPLHWRKITVILAHKPGRSRSTIQGNFRPLVLAELHLKALESALKSDYEAALLRCPLHPAVMAYRRRISGSTGVASFVLTETCNHVLWRGGRPVILGWDAKGAYYMVELTVRLLRCKSGTH